MGRYMIISSDCHAGANGREYRPYIDPEYREKFDDYLAIQEQRMRAMMQGRAADREKDESQAEREDATSSLWDMKRRLEYLEADGVVGEVIFPQPGGATGPPFYAIGHSHDPSDQELTAAGTRAYNRWLADFVASSPHPERHAGVAQITQYHDIDAAVREIVWAKEAGLRGVLIRSQPEGNLPDYNHPRYEPIWATCEELDMPVHTHGGESISHRTPESLALPGAMSIFFTEITWYGHRPLWFLIWSGALERHPNLKLVFTEQFADWVPDVLFRMDGVADGAVSKMTRNQSLGLKPSEYWARQCYVGSSLMTRRETDRRYDIGVDTILWGTDFPHGEGTYPRTALRLHEAFDGLPEKELRSMLGEKAAEVYHFDVSKLAPSAEKLGPEADFFDA